MEIEENVGRHIVTLIDWQQDFQVDSNSVHTVLIELFNSMG
jgi:hypothetical protein